MKKFLLLWLVLSLIWFTFASESFPAFPMTIYWNTNLTEWTIKVYDWLNHEISSYDITTSGKYWSENVFVLPLSLNSFEWGLSFKAIYNWQEYNITSIDDSNRWEWCPSKNSITFVSENCRYDLIFANQSSGSGAAYITGQINDYDLVLTGQSGSYNTWITRPRLKKDNCPGGDFSDSYYDGKCSASRNTHKSADELVYDTLTFNPHYSDEMNKAYQYAYYYWITTKSNIVEADMDWKLNRIAMAKMLSQYAINVLWKKPDTSKKCEFWDVTQSMDKDYNNWVTLACQLWIMWVWISDFRPNDLVIRAEFGTALSRMLFELVDGTDKYYSTHLAKLEKEWIITNTNPTLQELRWYVMLMLMRSAK